MQADKIDIIDFNDFNNKYDPSKNITMNIITLYEKTCIFGLRKQQISRGASSTLPKTVVKKMTSLDEIVEAEFNQQVIPFIICRKLPDGIKEYWKVKDLIDI